MAAPKKMGPVKAAAMVAHANLWGDESAMEKFDVSRPTVTRYRARLKNGTWPELTEAYGQHAKRQASRTQDLLDRVYDSALVELEKKLPEASARDVIGGVKILGELRLARNALREDDDNGRPARGGDEGQAAAEDTGREASAPTGPGVLRLKAL